MNSRQKLFSEYLDDFVQMAKITPTTDALENIPESPSPTSHQDRGPVVRNVSAVLHGERKFRAGSLPYSNSLMGSFPESRPRLRSKSIFDAKGISSQVHHHVHHHLHHHHHSPSTGAIMEVEVDDDEDDGELTALWVKGFPVLTKQFYTADNFKRRETATSITGGQVAQARDFFRVENVISCGFFSIVVKAVMKTNKKTVCIKMVPKNCDPEKRKYVLSEQKVLSDHSCVSPFIIYLHSSFQTKLHVYLVLEYIDGGSLEQRLEAVKVYSEKVAVFYMAEIVLGVFFLHQRGIIHRDLRLRNVLMRDTGHICLIDLGLCKAEMKNNFTSTVVGSCKEMAPEIHHNAPYNKAVDYWAMGILLYSLVHGQLPFQGKTRVDLYKSVTNEKEVYSKRLSENTVSLCKALLQKNQKNRLGFKEDSEPTMMCHPFFEDVLWERMEKRYYTPPFIPKTAHSKDELSEVTWPNLNEQNAVFEGFELGNRQLSSVNMDHRVSIIAEVNDSETKSATDSRISFRAIQDAAALPATPRRNSKMSAAARTGPRKSIQVSVPDTSAVMHLQGPSYLLYKSQGECQAKSPDDSRATDNAVGSQPNFIDDYVVYKLDSAKLSFQERVFNCFRSCWAFCVNHWRTQSASCRAVCCGLENVKAPVMMEANPRLNLNISIPDQKEIQRLSKLGPQQFFFSSDAGDVNEELYRVLRRESEQQDNIPVTGTSSGPTGRPAINSKGLEGGSASQSFQV